MKYLFSLLLAAVCSTAVFAQQKDTDESPDGFKKQNLFFGGNLSLLFGSYTLINVSPQVGYHLTPQFDAGAGINFQYVSQKDYYSNGADYSKQTYLVTGGNIFARYFPIRQGFIQAQPEFNIVKAKLRYYDLNNTETSATYKVPSLLVGVGANLNGLLISVLYDVFQDAHSPYSSRPFINFGYLF